MWFKPAKQMLIKQLKRGELTILIVAIVLAVSSVFSLSGFGERLNLALTQKSSDFLAADRVLSSAHPLPESLLKQANNYALRHAQYLTFNSVVFSDQEMTLSNSKAIAGPYPLRGQLRVSQQPLTNVRLEQQGAIISGPPPRGEVWVAPEILIKLNASIGSQVAIGESDFIISGIITFEPDATLNIFAMAPRIIINLADIAATEIVQPGARLQYRYLFSGTDAQLKSYYRAIKPSLQSNQSWQDIKNERSPLGHALERASRFLMLASLLGIILAATAIFVTASSYSQRQLDTVALLKTLGTPDRIIVKIFTFQLATILGGSIAIGLITGYALQQSAFALVGYYLPQSLPQDLPGVSVNAVVISILTGLICTVMFSVTPMIKLFKVPVMRVIKRDLTSGKNNRWLNGAIFSVAIFCLLWLYSRNFTLSFIIWLVAVITGLLLSVLAAVFIGLLHRRQFNAASPWQLAISSLHQRTMQASSQIASIAVAIMLMLVITLLNNELVDEWRKQIPSDGANHFLANITPDQIGPIKALMKQHQIKNSDLYPVTRGRVSAINQDKISGYDSENKQPTASNNTGRKGFGRELNLTWRTNRPTNNPLIAGQWWQGDETEHLVSIEQGVAKRLSIVLGDQLTILIGQDELTARVSNIRKVNWRSMSPNFLLIFNRAALGHVPSTYISSFYLPRDQHPMLDKLLRSYPTLSVIKVNRIINKLQTIIEHVALALMYIMVLVVCACLLVLLVQIQASYQQRHQDLVIMRTLGASKKLLQQAIRLEFLMMGALAGFIASLTTELALWLIQTYIIEMIWQPHPYLWLLATLGGAVFVAVVGTRACRQLMTLSPSQLIRNLS